MERSMKKSHARSRAQKLEDRTHSRITRKRLPRWLTVGA